MLLSHVPTPETERLVLAELAELYSGYFERLSNDLRYDEAFQMIERAHGRIEAQQLEYDRTELPHAATADDKRLQAVEIGLLSSDNPEEREQTLRGMRASPGEVYNTRGERTATLREVQGKLIEGELLIEYVLSKPRSYALAISSSSVKCYPLPSKETIEGESAAYRNILRSRRTDAQLGQRLFDHLLWFTRDNANAKPLIVVPEGALHLLPFSALIRRPGKYLLEEKSVSITLSGTVLSLLRARAPGRSAARPYLGVAAWTESVDSRPWVLRSVSASSQSNDLARCRNRATKWRVSLPRCRSQRRFFWGTTRRRSDSGSCLWVTTACFI